MVKVAITCTAPRCDTIATRLNIHGIDAIAIPALEVKQADTLCPAGDFDAILFTSAHAIKPNAPHSKLPTITVGAHTAKIAMDNGYDVVQIGDSNLKSIDISQYNNILYPCAAQPSLIPDNATPWVVYETSLNHAFTIPNDITIVAVFSAKAACVINGLTPSNARFICLSQFIADQMTQISTDRLAVCPQPDYDEMEKLIIRMCEEWQT